MNFFNVEGFGGHPDPTEAQLRWQVFTSLAYGAKGVLCYCYRREGRALCGNGGVLYNKAPVGQPGVLMRGRHYADATRINSVLKIYGAHLLTAVSTGVYRVQLPNSGDTGITNTCTTGSRDCPTGEQPDSNLSALSIQPVDVAVSSLRPGNGLLVGQFRLADGRVALLMHNQNWDSTLWPTIAFKRDVNASMVLELDPVTGIEAIVLDDSPGPTLQLAFGAAEARLLMLPLVTKAGKVLAKTVIGRARPRRVASAAATCLPPLPAAGP